MMRTIAGIFTLAYALALLAIVWLGVRLGLPDPFVEVE